MSRVLLSVLWIVLVLYPRPWDLAVSIQRAIQPPVDPTVVSELASRLPDDPVVIDQRVRSEIIPYAYDWHVYSEPWYFSSPSEALRDGRGDCESQAVVLASLLTAKGIEHKLQVSFDHIWVDYAQKKDNSAERPEAAVIEHVDGQLRVKQPGEFDWEEFLRNHNETHVIPMPAGRKALLLIGLVVILAWDASFLTALRARARRRFFFPEMNQ